MDKMQEFINLFKEYNVHTNLMSANDIEKLDTKHIPDCLNIKKFFEKYNIPQNILDIGTGGGLPSVPVAVCYPCIEVWAMDSISKKVKFIENVKEKLDLYNLHPVCSRIEDFDKKEFFDLVITRAVASLSVILEYSASFAKINGYIAAYKAKGADEELLEAETAMKILGIKFVDKINYNISDDLKRCILVFKKIKKTPLSYPRKNNLARKNPL